MIEKINKWLPAINTVAIVLILVGGNNQYGGTTNYDTLDVSDGYQVDGTTVIDGSGNIDGVITTTTITATGATAVETFTQGGGIFATTSKGSVTYPATAFDVENVIEHTTSAAVTATLPASSTLSSFVPNSGDTREIILKNIGTTRLTLVGASGTLLKVASSTDGLFIDSGDWGTIKFFRKTDTDIEAGWEAFHLP